MTAMQAMSSTEEQAELLRVLGHPMRLGVLKELTGGERAVGDIAERTGLGLSVLSQQLAILRKAIPMPTMHTLDTAWEVNLRTSVELYTIWEATGVLRQLEKVDENLFDVVSDVMEEKREEWEEWLEEQEDNDDDDDE